MSSPSQLKIERAFISVGTVSYPKKFGDTKFPITHSYLTIVNDSIGYKKVFSRLCVSSDLENIIGSNQDYGNWCLKNKIMKESIFSAVISS